MHVAFIEPHLKRYGGIRRVVELSNAMIARGHRVTLLVPPWERLGCDWMRCDAEVLPLQEEHPEPYDLVVFNHEPQWYLLERFTGARAHALYALHYSKLYGKEGSWEALRAPVDLRLANSTWTADQVSTEIGHPVTVLSGGINASHFRPLDVPKRYPLLCVGDDRDWKGTDDIEEAARRLGLPLERYAGKDLPQSAMAAEYAAAEIFVVGSHVEGFGQPGLEALACGTPLVTTDNGGCLDYAIHEETALVVPPEDPAALAAAIERLRRDPDLAARLRANGLAKVAADFSWPGAAERFEGILEDLLVTLDDGTAVARHGTGSSEVRLREPDAAPEVSVVVLAWDNLTLTQRCVETVRQHTDIPYELVVVDNGSQADAAAYARQAGDVVVMNDHNRGFAGGMNDGLAAATAPHVVFLNNDTELPPAWASRMHATATSSDTVGMVVPSLTAAGNTRTVREEPGEGVELLGAFEGPPSAVLVWLPTEVMRGLGGWDESYEVASGEDLDLAFAVWVNDLDIVWDRRVLVQHVGHATSDAKLPDRAALWARNRQQFLDRWMDVDQPVHRLPSTPDDRFDRNRRTAAGVASWMDRYFRARAREEAANARASVFDGARMSNLAKVPAIRTGVRGVWSTVRGLVPQSLRDLVWPYVRRPYYRFFPDRHPSVLRGERHAENLRP